MGRQELKRVEEIFLAALESEDRESYLARAADGDAELERAVRKLLATHDALPPDPTEPESEPRMIASLTDGRGEGSEKFAGRYRVDTLVGQGGMGAVYRAEDLRHGRDVAIKIMRSQPLDKAGVDRFLREIRLTAGLHHPHVLPLFDSGEVDGVPYFVMPFVDGSSLAQRIQEDGPLSVGEALGIVGQVASALDYAHENAVVHRDVKPGNVLVRGDTAFVCDFGIGFAIDAATVARITSPGAGIGSPSYMSPEQIAGEESIDRRTDVYGLACLTFEALTGDPPPRDEASLCVSAPRLGEALSRLAFVSPELCAAVEAVFLRALADAPEDRHATAGEFVEALAQALVVDARRSDLGISHSKRESQERGSGLDTGTPMAAIDQKIRICTARDGVQIAWAECGAGPPLVKAANWLSHLEHDAKSPMWRHWWAGLTRRNTLIRYDERGQGLSDRNAEDISFEAWVADLEAVVDAAGLERFTLLGVSKGGPIAVAYAHRHPERVERMVILGAYPLGRARAGDAEWESKARVEVELVKLGWGQENPAHRQVFSSLFFPDAAPQRINWFNELQRVSATPANAARIMEAAFDIDVVDAAKQLKIPTLVCHSEGDERVPVAAGRHLASLIPGAEFVPLPSRNHIPLEHEPAWQRFLDAWDEFTGTS